MSDIEGSNNNQLPPPGPSTPAITASSTLLTTPDTRLVRQTHRDLRFYYSDGSVVFLVNNTLFKVHASLLAADVEDYEFKHILKGVTDKCEGSVDRPGTSDKHPVVLPANISLFQFCDFLGVIYGGVTDSTLIDLLDTLRKPSRYTSRLVSRLTGIGHLACRFGMKRLDVWSQAQLYIIVHDLAIKRPVDDWSTQTILQLVQYTQAANTTRELSSLLDRMRHIMSALFNQAYQRNGEIPQGNIVDVCAALYKHKDLLINSPGFFGFIFAVIVSLGHQSPIWTDHLTREDRRVLYAAYASFTRLANHADFKLEVDWVIDPALIKEVCSQCSNKFDSYWRKSFSQCEGLVSRIPSQDMRHVVSLPHYRTCFWSASRTASCECAQKTIVKIGKRIEAVYCGLAEKYKLLAQTV